MQQQITTVKCDVVISVLLAFSIAFLIKLCRSCSLQGQIGKMFLDIHYVTYRENAVLSPNLVWHGPL